MSDAFRPLVQLAPPVLHRSKLAPLAWLGCAAGAVGLALAFGDGTARGWSALLIGLLLPLWLAVGGLFFIAVHAVCGARWTVPLARVMEGVGAGLPLAIVAFLVLGAFGLPQVYEWAQGNPGRDLLFRDPHGGKALWMTDLRWFASGALILALWLTAQRALARHAVVADAQAAARLGRRAVATLVLLVPTLTLFAWDVVLSLDVQFVSAVFGGYCLVTAIHAFLGGTALAVAWLSRRGLVEVVRPHLRRDLATWLIAWSCIVLYISYAQYVIIAFANLDEEVFWYLMRAQHGYGTEFLVGLALRCLPFLLLMPQALRTRRWALATAGAAVLAGTFIELHWLVVPTFARNHFQSPLGPEALVALGFLAGSFLLALRHWRRRGLVPEGDPRLLPAINAEHLHA